YNTTYLRICYHTMINMIFKLYGTLLLFSKHNFCYNILMDHNLEEKILNYNIQEWRHAFKLDPAKELDDEQLELLCESGTDAIIVGVTDDVDFEGVLGPLSRIRRCPVRGFIEVSEMDAI